MLIEIKKPVINRKTDRENIALIDKWIGDTADKLNAFFLKNDGRRLTLLSESGSKKFRITVDDNGVIKATEEK